MVHNSLILGERGVPYTAAYIPLLTGGDHAPVVIMIPMVLEEIFAFQNNTLLNTIVVFIALTMFALAIAYVNIYRTMINPHGAISGSGKYCLYSDYEYKGFGKCFARGEKN